MVWMVHTWFVLQLTATTWCTSTTAHHYRNCQTRPQSATTWWSISRKTMFQLDGWTCQPTKAACELSRGTCMQWSVLVYTHRCMLLTVHSVQCTWLCGCWVVVCWWMVTTVWKAWHVHKRGCIMYTLDFKWLLPFITNSPHWVQCINSNPVYRA